MNLTLQVQQHLAQLKDSFRRGKLYEHTLIPQAQTVLESVLGSFQTGRAGITAALLAQQDLVELEMALREVQTQHATAWSTLEALLGRDVRKQGGDDA